MKFVGHAWVAVNSFPTGNKKLLILGSILPEIMYYTQNHPFVFEEIHEGGQKLYQFLLKNKPEWKDIGLGMASHSVEMGADKFNYDENLGLLGYKGKQIEKMRNDLTEVLGISYETAKTRAHNILELATELTIIRKHPDFMKEFKNAISDLNAQEEIKTILSKCFHKPKDEVDKSVNELFNKARPEYFENSEGLAKLWSELSRPLPDPEPNTKKLSLLLEHISSNFQGKEELFYKKAIEYTAGNLEKIFHYSKERE
ncbi:hypothetical protein ACFL1Q_02970 [Patescibacteria group bacterium]